jgi:hypothetical protein
MDALTLVGTADYRRCEPVLIAISALMFVLRCGVPRIFFRGRGVRQEFFSGEIQQIQWRTESKENGDLGAVAP